MTAPRPTADVEWTLRPGVPDDAAALAGLARHAELVAHLLTMPTEREADWLARLAHQHLLVAEAGGRPVAMAALAPQDHPRLAHGAEVTLMVHPDWQGRGIGTALMAALLDLADRWLMLHRLEAAVPETSPRAEAFLIRRGFSLEGSRRQAVLVRGRYVDLHILGRLREQPASQEVESQEPREEGTGR